MMSDTMTPDLINQLQCAISLKCKNVKKDSHLESSRVTTFFASSSSRYFAFVSV